MTIDTPPDVEHAAGVHHIQDVHATGSGYEVRCQCGWKSDELLATELPRTWRAHLQS